MSRENTIDSVFRDTFAVFANLLSPLDLNEEEMETLEESAFLWLDRFSRRPGNEQASIEHLKISFISAGCNMARQIGERKGISLIRLSGDPIEIAIDLGVIRRERHPQT